MGLDQLFPVPILHIPKVNNFDNVQNEFSNVLNKVTFDKKSNWSTHYLSSLDFKSDTITLLGMELFQECLSYHVFQYCQYMGFNADIPTEVVSSWFSMFKKGDYGHLHEHGNADVSGVYYFKTNGNDGDIYFQNPNSNMMSSTFYRDSMFTIDHTYSPAEGQLLLFPGWLKHGIKRNKTDNTRISFSFNIHFDKNYAYQR
tara:strand:+ start:418 stop:1017 length:600 start_codon:yes stop_codon:yes gene_type:complete